MRDRNRLVRLEQTAGRGSFPSNRPCRTRAGVVWRSRYRRYRRPRDARSEVKWIKDGVGVFLVNRNFLNPPDCKLDFIELVDI